MSDRLAQVARSDRGAAAVEFALVSTMLLVLLLGIIEFGFIFQAQLALTNAAREGARMATVGKYNAATTSARAYPVTPVTVVPVPADPNAATSGSEITITLAHNWDWRVLPFPGTVALHGVAKMRKE